MLNNKFISISGRPEEVSNPVAIPMLIMKNKKYLKNYQYLSNTIHQHG